MARAYSLDLRERVVAAVAEGESCRAVAARFKVSVASVVKWSQRFRSTGRRRGRSVGESLLRLPRSASGYWPDWPRSPI
jgi:transposase